MFNAIIYAAIRVLVPLIVVALGWAIYSLIKDLMKEDK